jgi:hypothetical protein
MIISLTSQNYNTKSGFILPLRPGSNFNDISRRQERTPTLDGDAVITDFGFTQADRTFTLNINATEEQDNNLRQLIEEEYLFALSCREGLFYGSIKDKRGMGGNIRITFLVKEKAPPIFYPIPLSELPEQRVGGDDGFYAPAYDIFGEQFANTWQYISVGRVWGNIPPESCIAWMRFPNVEIPQGATVTSASMDLTNYYNKSGLSDVLCRIYAADTDNVTAPADKNELLALSWTTNYVNWALGDTTRDVQQTTPDLSSVVQEIVNRPGWSSGNAIMFLMNAPGTVGADNQRGFYTIESIEESYRPALNYTST